MLTEPSHSGWKRRRMTGHEHTKDDFVVGVDVVIAAGGYGTLHCVAETLACTGTTTGLAASETGEPIGPQSRQDGLSPGGTTTDGLTGTKNTIDVLNGKIGRHEHE